MIYRILYCIVRFVLFFWHPVFRVSGRENIPQDGNVLICANHSGLADPVWLVFALRLWYFIVIALGLVAVAAYLTKTYKTSYALWLEIAMFAAVYGAVIIGG